MIIIGDHSLLLKRQVSYVLRTSIVFLAHLKACVRRLEGCWTFSRPPACLLTLCLQGTLTCGLLSSRSSANPIEAAAPGDADRKNFQDWLIKALLEPWNESAVNWRLTLNSRPGEKGATDLVIRLKNASSLQRSFINFQSFDLYSVNWDKNRPTERRPTIGRNYRPGVQIRSANIVILKPAEYLDYVVRLAEYFKLKPGTRYQISVEVYLDDLWRTPANERRTIKSAATIFTASPSDSSPTDSRGQ